MGRIIMLLCFLLGSLTSLAQNGTLQKNEQVITFKDISFEVNYDGLPKRFFLTGSDSEVKGSQLLFEPMHFHFYTGSKLQEKMTSVDFAVTAQTADSIVWTSNSASANLKMNVKGRMLANGVVSYHINVMAVKDLLLTNINFHIPFEKLASKYLAGLGEKGGLRPDTVRWQYSNWKKVKPTVWIGNDFSGLYFNLRKPSTLLANDNSAMQINIKGSSMLLDVFAAQVTLKENEQLSFDFNLIVTPQMATELQIPMKKRLKFYGKIMQK